MLSVILIVASATLFGIPHLHLNNPKPCNPDTVWIYTKIRTQGGPIPEIVDTTWVIKSWEK